MTETPVDVQSIIGALKAALAADNDDVRMAFIQVALDFAENDPEVLAEGRAWADQEQQP